MIFPASLHLTVKWQSAGNITLDENGKLVRVAKEFANIFKDIFVNVVPNLAINTEQYYKHFS